MGSTSSTIAMGNNGSTTNQNSNVMLGNYANTPAGNGGHTAFVVDQRERYLFAACGNRGWLENGREEIGTFEIETSA